MQLLFGEVKILRDALNKYSWFYGTIDHTVNTNQVVKKHS